MGTAQLSFAGDRAGDRTIAHDGSEVTGSDVSNMTGSDISHVTGSDHVRKYVLHMRNPKLRHIRPKGAF